MHANNIPLPQVGYWPKLKYNKRPSIAILDNSIPYDHIINLQDYANKKSAHKSDISKSLEKAKKDHSLDILIRNYKERIEIRIKKVLQSLYIPQISKKNVQLTL